MSAHAFTYGKDIYFNSGEYRPESTQGRHLLAHELTHVLQQTGAMPAPAIEGRHSPAVSRAALEEEDDDLDAMAARGETVVSVAEASLSSSADLTQMSAERGENLDEKSRSLAENTETPATTTQIRMERKTIQARALQGTIQRQPKKKNYVPYQIHVKQPMTPEEFRVVAMRQIFGGVLKNVEWQNVKKSYVPENSPYTVQVDIYLLKQQRGEASRERGITVGEGGSVTGAKERAKTFHAGAESDEKSALMKEVDRRYFEAVGDKTKTSIKSGERGKAELWRVIRDEVLFQNEYIANLPPPVKELIKFGTSGKDLTPTDYDKVFAIAKKIEKMPAGQASDFASRVTATTTDLDVFEASLDKYLAEVAARDTQNKERDKIFTKLVGLEELYKKYKLYKTLLSAGGGLAIAGRYPGGGGGGGIVTTREALKMGQELETELQAHGFGQHGVAALTDFEEYIKKFERAFEAEAANIAKDLLAKFAGKLYMESERLKDQGEVHDLHQKLGGVRASYAEFDVNAQIVNEYVKAEEAREQSRLPGQGHLRPSNTTTASEAAAARNRAEAARAAAQSQVKGMSGAHPIFEEEGLPDDKRLDKVALAKASESQLGGLLQAQIQRRMHDIGEAKAQIDDKPELIYKMQKLFPQFYAQQGIRPGSIHDMIIQDKMRSDLIMKIVKGIAIAIVAIALAVVTFGTATPAIIAAGAAIAGAGLGVYQAYESYQEYVQEKDLADVGFAKDPSIVWLVIAVAGAALDMAAAVKAVSALGKAAQTLEAGGDLKAFMNVVKQLEEEKEITANIARAAERAAAARKGFAEASGELSKALGKAYSLPGPFTDPEVYKALVKMAREAIKTKVYDASKFLEELKLARVQAKLGDLKPEELAKVKQAWEEARLLEAAEKARYENLLKQIPDPTKLDALIAKAGDGERLERLLKAFPEAELETIFAKLADSRGLALMPEHVGAETGAGMIRGWMQEGANGVRKMNQFLERMAAGGKELAETSAVSAKALIIDSNTAIALVKDADPALRATLQPGEKAWVAYIKSLPPDTELRVANVTVGEIKGGVINVKGVPISVARESSDYQKVLKALADQKVGTSGGFADRGLIADAIFAKADPGVIPKLVTGDKNAVKNLARMATTPIDVVKAGGYPGLAAKYGSTGFEVTIEGRKLMVVPLPVP